LPRPNSRSTTPITMIQCQMLSEPIELPPNRRSTRSTTRLYRPETRPHSRQKQALRPGRIDAAAAGPATAALLLAAISRPTGLSGLTSFLLHPRREPEIEIALLERILIL